METVWDLYRFIGFTPVNFVWLQTKMLPMAELDLHFIHSS